MTDKKKSSKTKKDGGSGRLAIRFGAIVVSIVFLYSVCAVAGVVIYGVTRGSEKVPASAEAIETTTAENGIGQEDDTEDVKKITNVAVFGVDKGWYTNRRYFCGKF